jgi:methylated-DNA-[protein]-cysteine S-methyltransferase
MDRGFALFESAIGACGIAWSQNGLRGLQLPERDHVRGLARLKRRFADLDVAEPSAAASAAVSAITRFLDGDIATDLSFIQLDLDGVGAWEAEVYRAAREISVGSFITYGELARSLGGAGKARAVGQALGRNPWPIVVPCHRVTAAGGATGGFSAPDGVSLKLRLLDIEGALAPEALPLFAFPGE